MPGEQRTPRAELVELDFDDDGTPIKKDGARQIEVQFNPQTLQVNYTNQKSGGDQQGSSGMQYVGKGSTTLSVDLLFDVTHPDEDEEDVRKLTENVNMFMRDLEEGNKEGQYIPPGIRFVWGSFQFDGVMDSMDETLEFFNQEGRPLRATVSISISRKEIQFAWAEGFRNRGGQQA